MSTWTTLWIVIVLEVLAISQARASTEMSEQAARDQATDVVRSVLPSMGGFKADRFLDVQRDEQLEKLLGIAAGEKVGPIYIYRISPEGVELKEHAIIYHYLSDIDPVFIVAVNPSDRSIYRVHGFGGAESSAGFEKLLVALKLKVASPDQAESLADLYREVNPENYEGLSAILDLLALKQAAERQCQSGSKSFDADQRAFSAWWRHARPMYSEVSFKPTAAPSSDGYFAEWIILSHGAKGNCGGAALRVRLPIGTDGQFGKMTVAPLRPN